MNAGDVVRLLTERRVADWVLTTRDQDVTVIDQNGPRTRTESRTRWTLIVHDDVSAGRGSAQIDTDGRDGNASDLVDQAISIARAAIGTPWRSPPPAAPAHVDLRDPALDVADPHAVERLLLASPVKQAVTVLRERVTAQSKQGLKTSWTATHAAWSALVTSDEHSVLVAREARLGAALETDKALRGALDDLKMIAAAGPPIAGRCNILFHADALLHGGGYGLWGAFASQADAVLERQGLTRYREGHPVAERADVVDDPLTIASDGAIDHGLLSAPVGDDGDAVRAFTLVDRGVAAGLGMSPREAALRRREPNGGVRNLIVQAGKNELPPAPDLVEIRRLRSLSIDPYTGDASMEIALGIDHRAVAGGQPFAGGTLRVDLVAALATARRSVETLSRGPYTGPRSVLASDLQLLA